MNPTIQRRYRIEPGELDRIKITLVGCGGTGSFAALHLARLAYTSDIPIQLVFVDPDLVEEKNIGRQNFVPAEIGLPKAVALARRYSYGFGLEIETFQERVGQLGAHEMMKPYGSLMLVVGCVDSIQARREISDHCKPGMWWLDAGNSEFSGQVLIGNGPKATIDATGFCTDVPWPGVQEPDLVQGSEFGVQGSEFRVQGSALSCAELMAVEAQSLMINQAMAGWLGVYAYRLLLGRDLDMMATYINLQQGTARSVGITGQADEIGRGHDRRELHDGIWTDDELLQIADGECPECGGGVAGGRDTYNGLEVEIVFCPVCTWQMPADELEMLLLAELQE